MAEDMKAVAAVITTLAGKPMYGQRVKKKSNLFPGSTTKGTAKGAKDTAEGAKGAKGIAKGAKDTAKGARTLPRAPRRPPRSPLRMRILSTGPSSTCTMTPQILQGWP